MKRILSVAAGLAIVVLVLGLAQQTAAKHTEHYIAPSVITASDIPYPLNTVASGVVSFAVNLGASGNVTDIQTLRDIPTITSHAAVTLQGWTYAPATLNGKHVASTLIVHLVFDPAFLDTNHIPLGPPESFQPAVHKSSYSPPQLFTATFPPYPANGVSSGAVVLDVTLDATGKISQVRPIRDIQTLTGAAVAAVQNWSFSAATYANTPIASKVVVAMIFRSPASALP
ncbi:MAG: energy transducer TonB [Candidatus Acidiferrales bacterium]